MWAVQLDGVKYGKIGATYVGSGYIGTSQAACGKWPSLEFWIYHLPPPTRRPTGPMVSCPAVTPYYHIRAERDKLCWSGPTACHTSETKHLHSFPSSYTVYFLINLIYFGMPLQDRTNEFLACVESIRTRSSLPAKHPGKLRQARADSKTEFTRMASAIGKDISGTTAKLGKLAQCGHPHPLLPSLRSNP